MLHKATKASTTFITEKMSTVAPLAVGTRGTVGSLVRREIEYFRRLELDKQSANSKRHEKRSVDISHSNGNTRSRTTTLGYLLNMSWRRKKRSSSSSSGSGNFFPNMCSGVDVRDSNSRLDGIPGFSYRNLRDEMEDSFEF
ncbi:hypothetical protein Ancab_004930 [Ancistrocladus abbreviatus]